MTPAPRTRAAIGVDLFTVAMIVSVAIALAQLTWRILGDSGLPARPVPVVLAPPPAPVDLTAITAASPFGTAAAAAGPAAGNLILRAIMFARPATASTALISAGDTPAILLHVGDPAPGGAIVDGIALDHVVLRTSAGLQTLAFPKPGAPAAGAAPSAQPFVGLPTPTAPVAIPSAPLLLPPPPTGGARIGFLDSIGATPTQEGYRIGADAPAAMRAAGLQPGDVVQKINGTTVGNADTDRALFASAVSGGALRVELVRNGRHIAVSLPAR